MTSKNRPPREGILRAVRAPADDRFTAPLYTIREAARYLGVSPSRFGDWVRGRGPSEPIITVIPSERRREAEIPFVGLTEGLVVAAFRRAGASLQYIRKALKRLEEEIGVEHAFASRRLYTHGAKVLYNYAEEYEEGKLLVEVVSRNYVFEPVVEGFLKLISYGED